VEQVMRERRTAGLGLINMRETTEFAGGRFSLESAPAKGRASVLKSDARANPQAIPMKTRILLADDHQLFREALCHLLDSQSDLEVAGQVGNGLEVVEQARRTGAQIVCMDISMPGMHGAEVTRSLLTALPLVKVVALGLLRSAVCAGHAAGRSDGVCHQGRGE
jgi:PleD family two-component response regulator